MSFSVRRLFVAIFVFALFAAPLARAQSTRSWTGLASPDNNWTTLGNWNTGIPISGDTALFDGSGNANTNISLGLATQPIKTIRFDGAVATPYTLGVLNSGDKFNFDSAGSIVVASNIAVQQAIAAAIQMNGSLAVTNNGSIGLSLGGNLNFASAGTLTLNNAVANTTMTVSGNISDTAGQTGAVTLLAGNTGAANINNFIISGTNTYTGPTSIQVNTGTGGSIQLGSNSPFGTGTVTLTLTGNAAPQIRAVGDTRTISNAFNLSAGMTYVGNESFVFAGPLTIINPNAGGGRGFTNNIAAAGKTVTLGATPGSSTITLGNPTSNGGDGIGKTATFTPAAGATTIINDVLQDPAAGGGAASGNVVYAGAATGVSQINGTNTYTGTTFLNGLSTIKFSSNAPFGTGTITANNSVNNILMPVGGNRSISNPISMVFGLTFANDTGDTSGVTLSGPISMTTNSRFLNNNFGASGGILTLGSAASPSTITLPTVVGQSLTINGTGATIINDVIQNSAPGIAGAISYTTSGPVTLNSQSTYTGDTSLGGTSTQYRIGASSNALPGASFTSGPFGTGTVTINNVSTPMFRPVGSDRTISNAINMNFGFTTATDLSGTHNLTFAGPITLGATGRTITNNFAAGAALTFGAAGAPSTMSLGSTLTVQTQVSGGGLTVINDAVSGAGGITVQSSASVQLNGATSYTGTTTVTGSGSKLFVNAAKTGGNGISVSTAGSILGGSGSIAEDIANSGTIAPGNTIGTLTVNGAVTMNPSSRLAIELNGVTADKLAVAGNLNLSNVDFLDITGVGQGTSWVIATYGGTRTGTFNNVTSGYTVEYGAATNGEITLKKAASGVNGDFNNDGKVDASDYLNWRKNNGTSNALINDNGLGTPIGPNHYTLWRSNFGKPPGSGSGALSDGGAVPEPASLLLILAGILGLTAIRTRRRIAK